MSQTAQLISPKCSDGSLVTWMQAELGLTASSLLNEQT
jgi:hypothetical protein